MADDIFHPVLQPMPVGPRLLVLCTSRLEIGAGGWFKAQSAASFEGAGNEIAMGQY